MVIRELLNNCDIYEYNGKVVKFNEKQLSGVNHLDVLAAMNGKNIIVNHEVLKNHKEVIKVYTPRNEIRRVYNVVNNLYKGIRGCVQVKELS